MFEKNLEIKIRIKSTRNREQEDRNIMNEIRSWLEILREEIKEES